MQSSHIKLYFIITFFFLRLNAQPGKGLIRASAFTRLSTHRSPSNRYTAAPATSPIVPAQRTPPEHGHATVLIVVPRFIIITIPSTLGAELLGRPESRGAHENSAESDGSCTKGRTPGAIAGATRRGRQPACIIPPRLFFRASDKQIP